MSAEIEFENIDEFRQQLSRVAEAYTELAEKHLKKAGNKLKKLASENTPISGEEHTNSKGKTVKPLSKSWQGKITGLNSNEIQYELRNSSKVYHLVERGHVQKTRSGEVVGFVQGKHFFDQVIQQFQTSNIMQEELEKFMEDIKRKLE